MFIPDTFFPAVKVPRSTALAKPGFASLASSFAEQQVHQQIHQCSIIQCSVFIPPSIPLPFSVRAPDTLIAVAISGTSGPTTKTTSIDWRPWLQQTRSTYNESRSRWGLPLMQNHLSFEVKWKVVCRETGSSWWRESNHINISENKDQKWACQIFIDGSWNWLSLASFYPTLGEGAKSVEPAQRSNIC